MSHPIVSLSSLPHTDGSVDYSWGGHNILASVNAPLEPQRKDELPEDAALEVNIRQPSGGGAPRDRHAESLIHRSLRALIITTALPRTLIQITLQILRQPPPLTGVGPPLQSDSILPALPHLLNAAVLGLLDANVPMLRPSLALAVAVVSDRDGDIPMGGGAGMFILGATDTPLHVLQHATSLHVFAFANKPDGVDLLLAESAGDFTIDEWEEAHDNAERRWSAEDGLETWLRKVIGQGVVDRNKWRQNTD